MMPFANKIIVIHRTAVHMAVHTAMCTGRSHDPYMAVYTSVHSSVHDPLCIRHIHSCVHRHGPFTAVYVYTCTRAVYMGYGLYTAYHVHGTYTAIYKGRHSPYAVCTRLYS